MDVFDTKKEVIKGQIDYPLAALALIAHAWQKEDTMIWEPICTGTLVHIEDADNYFVLTSAHCFHIKDDEEHALRAAHTIAI